MLTSWLAGRISRKLLFVGAGLLGTRRWRCWAGDGALAGGGADGGDLVSAAP